MNNPNLNAPWHARYYRKFLTQRQQNDQRSTRDAFFSILYLLGSAQTAAYHTGQTQQDDKVPDNRE
jgi:hypothetical protein